MASWTKTEEQMREIHLQTMVEYLIQSKEPVDVISKRLDNLIESYASESKLKAFAIEAKERFLKTTL